MFLISNGLYLTTVYDEVNDPNISCMISVLVLAYSLYMMERVTTEDILNV